MQQRLCHVLFIWDIKYKVQSTKVKFNFDKIIKFMLEDDYNRLLIIIIINTKHSVHPTTNYL